MTAQLSQINKALDAAESGPDGLSGLLRLLAGCPARTALVMSGIPGAGKSSFLQLLQSRGLIRPEAYWLDPDGAMKAMPEYRRDFKVLGQDEAYARWELPARRIAYAGFEEARRAGLPVVIDMACARRENLDMVRALKDGGYTVYMIQVLCPPEVAHQRARRRDRPMPLDRIIERMAGIAALAPEFRNLADDYLVLDNGAEEQPFRPLSAPE